MDYLSYLPIEIPFSKYLWEFDQASFRQVSSKCKEMIDYHLKNKNLEVHLVERLTNLPAQINGSPAEAIFRITVKGQIYMRLLLKQPQEPLVINNNFTLFDWQVSTLKSQTWFIANNGLSYFNNSDYNLIMIYQDNQIKLQGFQKLLTCKEFACLGGAKIKYSTVDKLEKSLAYIEDLLKEEGGLQQLLQIQSLVDSYDDIFYGDLNLD